MKQILPFKEYYFVCNFSLFKGNRFIFFLDLMRTARVMGQQLQSIVELSTFCRGQDAVDSPATCECDGIRSRSILAH